MPKYDMIHIGFEKYDFNKNRWRIPGIDDELKKWRSSKDIWYYNIRCKGFI